jgi:glycosyltransferase involved in cell wall biosynthesis
VTQKECNQGKDPVIFSVIIPHYNDEKRLYNCLTALYRQNYDLNQVEIIVVDDYSQINVEKKLKSKFPYVRFYRLPENRGPGATRNFGTRIAQGKYLAYVDSDVEVGPFWLEALSGEFEKDEKIICGQMRHKDNFLAKLTALTAFGDFLDTQDGYKPNFPSANYAILSEVMRNFSFVENIKYAGPEDLLLSKKLVKQGFRIRFSANAWVLHDPELTVKKFNRRAYFYGFGYRDSRARDPDLPGYWLHYYLRAASCLPLAIIRMGIDLMRMIKHRQVLKISPLNICQVILGVLWTRTTYAIGVAVSYASVLKNSSQNNNPPIFK